MTKHKETLRDAVLSKSDTEWFVANKKNVMFELNHLELHHLDNYLLNLYNKGVKDLDNKNNSNIAFLLGMTNQEPHGKIHTKGGGFPDIDSDIARNKREEVFEDLKKRYGDGFAHLGTLTYTGGKNAWKSAARIHGLDFAKANKVSSMMPDIGCPHLKDLIQENKELKKIYDEDPEIREIYDDAIALSDCIGATGIHACYASNTYVLTDKGQIYIQDIKNGDRVLTKSGKYEKVLDTMQKKSSDIYSVSGKAFVKFEATGDHPIYTARKINGQYVYGFKSISSIDTREDFLVHASINEAHANLNLIHFDENNPNFWELIGLLVNTGHIKLIKSEKVLILQMEKNDNYQNYVCKLLKDFEIDFDFFIIDENLSFVIKECNEKYSELFDLISNFSDVIHKENIPIFMYTLPKELLKSFFIGYNFRQFKNDECEEYLFTYHFDDKCILDMGFLCSKAFGVSGIRYVSDMTGPAKRSNYWVVPDGGEYGIVKDVDNILCKIDSIEKLDKTSYVYNLTVENNHTFVANNLITHNCGVAISDRPLWEDVPLWDSKGAPVIQWEGNKIEAQANVVKLDLLGLKTLELLAFARDLIKRRHGVDIDWYNLPIDDEKAYKVLWNERNYGIFQFEEAGMSGFVNACKPKTIHDIAVIVSTWRPGPLGIPGLVERIIGKISGKIGKTDFLFPKYNHLFKNSHNELIFQEGLS